jgi:hypothetical protein
VLHVAASQLAGSFIESWTEIPTESRTAEERELEVCLRLHPVSTSGDPLLVCIDNTSLKDAGARQVNPGIGGLRSDFRSDQGKDSDSDPWSNAPSKAWSKARSKAPSNAGRNSGRYTRSKTPGNGGSKALSISWGKPEGIRLGHAGG